MPGINGHTPQAYSGGSWKNWEAVSGNIDGTWRTASDVYVKHNDTWKQVWVRLTAPTSGSRSISHVTVTISWTAGVGQEGFKLYRNGVFVKNVAANATSTTDVVPAMYTNYTYTVSAYAGSTETAQISCGAAVQATIGTPTLSSSVSIDWAYYLDSWNGYNLEFTNTSTSVANASGYRFEYNYANLGGTITYNTTTSTSVTLETPQDYDVTVRVQAYVDHNSVRYYGSYSSGKRLLSGRPLIRTARTDSYSVESWEDRERYNGPGVTNSTTLPTSYTAIGTIVDWYDYVNLSVNFASQITSSTRSVVLVKPGTNVTLSGTPYVSNGYDSSQFTNYTDSSNGYRIDCQGSGWFPFANTNKLTGTIRFRTRYISQAASAASVS